jgi:hypothetical protein
VDRDEVLPGRVQDLGQSDERAREDADKSRRMDKFCE